MDISLTKWNTLRICFWFFIYSNFKPKEVFHFQETRAHVIFVHISVALYENLVALTSNWLLSDCCLLADFDPYVISRLYPDSNSFSQLHVCSGGDLLFNQYWLSRLLTCLMFNSTLKCQWIVLLSHHFVMQSHSTEAIWSILKSSSINWVILLLTVIEGVNRLDLITFLLCWSRSMPITCYQDKHLKFTYMSQSH